MNSAPFPWWQRAGPLAAILVMALVPLLWPSFPPLTDLPGHVARWHIAAAGPGSPLLGFYQVHHALIGNLGTDLIGIPLSHALGPALAARLVVMSIVLLTTAGLLLLAREVHGRIPPTTLFALPLAYAWPLQRGFANFTLSQALAFLALALWIRLGRADRPGLRAVLFAGIGLLIWVAHSGGWGLFGLMAFGAELARLRETGRRWPAATGGAILACLPLALPVLIMIAQAPPPGSRAGETGDWFDMTAKFIWAISTLRDRWQWFDLISLLALLLILYMGGRDRRLGYSPLLVWPALLCILGFLLLPRLLLGGANVDMRMMPAIWALGLLAIRPPEPGRFARILALAGLLFFGARTAATTLSFALTAGEQKAELAVLPSIPRGAAVLALVYRPCLTPWSDIRDEHLPAHAIIARQAFVNEQWAIAGQQNLTVRHQAAKPFDSDPSQLVYPASCASEHRDRSLDAAIAHFPRAAFSHVWIIGNRLRRPRQTGFVPVWTNGHSELYEVVGAAGAGRVDHNP